MPACRGCTAQPALEAGEPPGLGAVVVKAPDTVSLGPKQLRIDEGRLASEVESKLREANIFVAPKTGAAMANVRLTAEGFVEGSALDPVLGVKVRLGISVRPWSKEHERYGEDVLAIGQAKVDETTVLAADSPLQRLVEHTAEDLLQAYVRRQKLWRADQSEVAVALASDDRDLRVEALRVIGKRKLGRLSASVLLLLTDADEAVRDAALGALVALGDRSVIKALADSHQMRDTREMRKVLDAIGTLGGQEAQEYLSFVAETHDDEEIRDMAKEALDRLRRRAVASPSTK